MPWKVVFSMEDIQMDEFKNAAGPEGPDRLEDGEKIRRIPDFTRFVAVDIETTGLDPVEGEIIELGAVRFINGQESESFRTLVKPEKGFPERNKRLTGIDAKALESAPGVSHALDGFREFIADDLLVSHNAPFDTSFISHHLEKSGQPPIENPALCTLHFSAFINPEAPTLQLTALAKSWGVEVIDPHRAMQDARMAGRLAIRMMDEVNTWPKLFIKHAATYRGKSFDPLFDLFDWMVKDAGIDDSGWIFGETVKQVLLDGKPSDDLPPLRFVGPPGSTPVDDPSGAEEIRDAFSRRGITLLEDNRTGSELISRSVKTGEIGFPRLVVGIPDGEYLGELLQNDNGTDGDGESFYLGRRSEYISIDRAFNPDGKPSGWLELSPYERVVLVRWLAGTRTGRISKVNWWLLNNYSGLKGHLHAMAASDPECAGTTLPYEGPCFAETAREKSRNASRVIVDHLHLCSAPDGGPGSERLLESIGACIVEKASELITSARESEGRVLEVDGLNRKLGALLDRSEEDPALVELAGKANSCINDLLESCKETIRVYRDEFPQSGTSPIPIDDESWSQEIFFELSKALKSTGEALGRIATQTTAEPDSGFERKLMVNLLKCTSDTLALFSSAPKGWALSIEGAPARNPKRVTLRMFPVEVGDVIHRMIGEFSDGIVFTDRRLRDGGSFDRIRIMLDIPSDMPVTERVLEDRSIVFPPLFLPEDINPPTSRTGRKYQWQKYMERTANLLRMLAESLGGRTVAAFSAHHELRKVREILDANPPRGCIVLAQYMDGTKSSLVREYLTNPATLLLGGRSFLDGVDLRPAGFTALVLVKLPFVSPEEPIHRAALKSLESQGIDGMTGYLVPLAVERSNRWIDSLIMGKMPEGADPDAYPGAVILLDPRPTQNEWGDEFISSLVATPVYRLSFRELLSKLTDMSK